MTEQELQALKDQIKAELLDEIKTEKPVARNAWALVPTREKYFNNKRDLSPMFAAFKGGGVRVGPMWDIIRKLTCCIMDASLVSGISDPQLGNEIASEICEAVLRGRKKYLESRKRKEIDQT